jgi:hypothetical protein
MGRNSARTKACCYHKSLTISRSHVVALADIQVRVCAAADESKDAANDDAGSSDPPFAVGRQTSGSKGW